MHDDTSALFQYSFSNSGPVMFQYVWWVLFEAQKRHIQRLYFLARDGYVLCKIAEEFCKAKDLQIECKYLYCSRKALRGASYHLLSDEETLQLLLMSGGQLTPYNILSRSGIEESDIFHLLEQLGVTEPNKKLSKAQFNDFCGRVRACPEEYLQHVRRAAEEQYPTAIGYFKQEGLLQEKTVAIVDSGWTGSMQRSLRFILESAGFTGNLVGFYFGMFKKPKDAEDGVYLTYYFNVRCGIHRRVWFNNNLFECYLSAPHGMTIGYEHGFDAKGYVPILSKQQLAQEICKIDSQAEGIISYARNNLGNIDFASYNLKLSQHATYKRLKRCMINPTKAEVIVIGSLEFCDDITENYHIDLASPDMVKQLEQFLVHKRIGRMICKSRDLHVYEPIFWPFGVLAFISSLKRIWYKANILGWEYIRCLLR